ncbi:MAG: hypothetical protein U1C55_06845 [Smithellaceae bacterium]|nr:hypothetical protein [Smithellaceae bacterium]
MTDQNEYLKENEEITKRFNRLECSLTSYQSHLNLFAGLLRQIKHEFEIPYVWISLIDSPDWSELIRLMKLSPFLLERLNLIEKNVFTKLVGLGTAPLLANGDLTPCYVLLPPKVKYFMKSICIAPISCRGEIIGSFNHADYSPLRYQQGMDYTLLEDLMKKISARLTELS